MNEKLQLHWSPRSPYVRKVMICAHELNMLPKLELIRSVAAMLKPNPDIMVANPLSKIPTLVRPDGSVLFDSVVICEYLNDLAGGTLFPLEGEARWQSLRWHAFGDGLLDALILWRNEREREQPLQALIDAFELQVSRLAAPTRLRSPGSGGGSIFYWQHHPSLRPGLHGLPLRPIRLA